MAYTYRVTILSPVASVNAMNEQVLNWAQLAANRPCKHFNISDGERMRAGETLGHKKARFVIRYSSDVSGVDHTHRLTFGGRTYDIDGVKELGRNKELEITATARADAP